MDVFDFDNVKIEKANAMLRYRRVRNIAKLFRIVELCLALVFISYVSSRLPFAMKTSGEYFRQLIAIIISPIFVFVLSNVIVLTLVAKSGQFTGQSSTVNNAETDLYKEFIKYSENRINTGLDNSPTVPEPEEVVYQDKQIIREVNTNSTISKHSSSEVTLLTDSPVYRRSKSENLTRVFSEKPSGKLRRSETEICGKVVSPGEIPVGEKAELVNELSNEEFNRTIEAFIAKQVRFHKEEKLAIVLPSHTQS